MYGGVTRGWDQSTKDNNGSIDGLFGKRPSPSDEEFKITFNGSVGPQRFKNSSDYRYVFEGDRRLYPQELAMDLRRSTACSAGKSMPR